MIQDVAMSVIFAVPQFSCRIADIQNPQSSALITIGTKVITVQY